METFAASAIQFEAGADKQDNRERAAALVRREAAAGARLVALPELFFWAGRQSDEAHAAETIPGPTTDYFAALAKRLAIHLVAGSILEQTPREAGEQRARCYNTATLFTPDGQLAAAYRKVHLFDVDIEGEVTINESATRRAGAEVTCVKTELGLVGLAICYDLRFPELFRALADRGAEIVVMPSAFTAPTGRAHWHTLVRARAIENQCYLVAPNQVGATAHGFGHYGHSLVVDPWGEVLADAGTRRDASAAATIDAERLAQVRRRIPSLENRRLAT